MRIKPVKNLLRPKIYIPMIAVIFLAAIPLITSNSYIISLLTIILFYAVLSEAWNVLGGYAGQFSLGHAAFFGLGAYTSTLMFISWKVSPWIGMFVGGGLSVFFGLMIGSLGFRLKGPYFSFITIAFAEVIRLLFLNLRSITGGPEGLVLPLMGDSLISLQFLSKKPFYYIILAILLFVAWFTYRIRNSQTGLYLIAIREDEDAAQSLGINITRYKLIALAISVFFTALAGTFYAQYLLYIDPDSTMSIGLSIEIALPAIIGGMGTILGPVLGSFILRPISEFTRAIFGGGYAGVYLMIHGIILILTVILLPNGIAERIMKRYEATIKKLPGGEKD